MNSSDPDESGERARDCHNMKDLFLKLIQPIPLKKALEISGNDLSEITSLAQRHNLLMLLYVQLKRYHGTGLLNGNVQAWLEQLRPVFLSNAVHSMRQEGIEKEVISLLKGEGVPAIVIKGNEIAREIYDDPNCRTCCDIDVLIRMSDVLQADSILTKARYLRVEKTPLKFWFSRLHHAPYHHPKTNDLVEIHWNFGIPSFFKLTSEKIWDEVIRADAGEVRLSADMTLVALLIHHYLHAFRDLKVLIDILWTLHKYENIIDWPEFSKKLKKMGIVKTTLITLNQIQILWKESATEMQSLQTLHQEIQGMGYKEPIRLCSFFEIDVEKKDAFQADKDKVMTRFALDRWPTIIFSFYKTLFPLPEAIKELYDDKRNWTLPINYLRFMTWRIRDWAGVREH